MGVAFGYKFGAGGGVLFCFNFSVMAIKDLGPKL